LPVAVVKLEVWRESNKQVLITEVYFYLAGEKYERLTDLFSATFTVIIRLVNCYKVIMKTGKTR